MQDRLTVVGDDVQFHLGEESLDLGARPWESTDLGRGRLGGFERLNWRVCEGAGERKQREFCDGEKQDHHPGVGSDLPCRRR